MKLSTEYILIFAVLQLKTKTVKDSPNIWIILVFTMRAFSIT